MQLLDNYLALQKEIYEYFGVEETWQVLSIEDERQCYWYLDECKGIVHSADTEEELISETGNYYETEFYYTNEKHKAVYTTEDYTLVTVDTYTDGNRFMFILDNAKRRQEYANRD